MPAARLTASLARSLTTARCEAAAPCGLGRAAQGTAADGRSRTASARSPRPGPAARLPLSSGSAAPADGAGARALRGASRRVASFLGGSEACSRRYAFRARTGVPQLPAGRSFGAACPEARRQCGPAPRSPRRAEAV